MPELPDVIVYCESLARQFAGKELIRIDLKSAFLIRTFDPPLEAVAKKKVNGFSRLGKRVIWELEDEFYLVVHLMIAGRFHMRKPQTLPKTKSDLAAFQFEDATLMLTEAGSKRRASLHVVEGREGLQTFDRKGLDVLSCTVDEFRQRLLVENHTVKRALTDPRLFDGIGNAYSDEILHCAGLSPVQWTSRLDDEEIARLFASTVETLQTWIERLQTETEKKGFPEKVTAFRPEMAVHGKFGMPCPICNSVIQRIRYANNETNYCPCCQTAGKILADRSLSRLLKGDWPKTIDELEG